MNDEPRKYETEVKATLKGRDVTAMLQNLRIDIATFGHLEKEQPVMADLERLTPIQRQSLVKAGLIDSPELGAQAEWTVEKKYYWSQRFPAHATVRIRHAYKPATGAQVMGSTEVAQLHTLLHSQSPEYPLDIVQSFCPEQPLLDKIGVREKVGSPVLYWVDFILTSANTWKRPIENFTLIAERPHGLKDGQVFVSFCSPGKVEKTDADHFKVEVRGFVPDRELRIGFIRMSMGANQ